MWGWNIIIEGFQYSLSFLTPLSSHATLPNKNRRATGVPNSVRRPSNYEDTEIDLQFSSKPRAIRKSSSPSPLHGGGGGSVRRFRDGSPKLPSPYQTRKLGVSPSSGDGSDLSKRLSGSQHSSSSSLNQLSDIDTDAYEPIADFLKGDFLKGPESSLPMSVPQPSTSVPQPSTSVPQPSMSVPQPQTSAILEQDESFSSSIQSFNAPSYPAPIPPKKHRENRISERFEEADEDADEDDDEGYTKVKLEGGQVNIDNFGNDVERAPLPLLSTSSTRSSLASVSTHSSPMRYERQRSPSAPDIGGPGISGLARSPPKVVSTYSGKVVLPPEPTSPPPEPPTYPRDPTSPIPINVKSPSPLLLQQNIAHDGGQSPIPPSSNSEEQPKLPPKKRNFNSVSSNIRENVDDDIYSFDTLDPPVTPTPTQSAPPPVQTNVDDDIYAFDTLDPPPPMLAKSDPRKSIPTSVQPTYEPVQPTYEPFQPSYDDENIYEFDGLEDMTPVPVPEAKKPTESNPTKRSFWKPKPDEPPPIPRKSTMRSSFNSAPAIQQNYQYQDDDDVYSFDSLDPPAPKPTVAKKPEVPSPYKMPPSPSIIPPSSSAKSLSSEKPQLQLYDDIDVYTFDSLDPPEATGSFATRNLSPDVGQSSDHSSASSPPDQMYFDHLVTGQRPVPPIKPPPVFKYGAGGVAMGKPPTVPPKSSPPSVKRKGEGISVSL